MKNISKIIISTIGGCLMLGTTIFATETVTPTYIEISLNDTAQVKPIDSRIEALQKAEAEKCFNEVRLNKTTDTNTQKAGNEKEETTIEIPRKYNLSNTINIVSKNQGQTNSCWTIPATTVLETNIAMKTGRNGMFDTLSSKHMDYATSQSFTNGTFNRFGYDREVNTSGTMEWALAYYTNGSGAIPEISMPLNEKNETFGAIDISKVTERTVTVKVEDWVQLPGINKTITEEGIKYTRVDGTEYTEEELQKAREKIKQHIMENGAIATETYIAGIDEYYNRTTDAYYCDDENQKIDHEVSIIGWDDDYPKENFNAEHRPIKNGAYIVQNSWGQNSEVAQQFYISYEDKNIEKNIYGIINAGDKDNTETIYQYDELGRNTSIAINKNAYGANVFERDANVKETIKEVAISTYGEIAYEVYVNPKNGNINSEDMVLVGKSEGTVENGYHTIKFEPIELTGSKFAVAVKYIGEENTLVAMQTKNNGAYSYVTSNEGESYLGLNLDNMTDIKTMDNIPEGNICIKAFTNKEGQEYKVPKGDANLDGKITAEDMALLKMHLAGLVELRKYAFNAVDFNEDGELTVTDLSLQMNFMVGM